MNSKYYEFKILLLFSSIILCIIFLNIFEGASIIIANDSTREQWIDQNYLKMMCVLNFNLKAKYFVKVKYKYH